MQSMNLEKRVSVIIPCYNCTSFIENTLTSLAAQTYRDFEVVCVNDGSTDNTLAILNRWKERSELDMQIISKTNGGVSSTRNAGIQAAKGDYLLFLDADDMYHPRYIQLLYEALTQTNADVSYCWLSRKEGILSDRFERPALICQTQQEAMHNLLYRMPELGFYCYLYRKDWILRENLMFDENTRHFEDREFNWKYLCHCQSAVLVDAPLYFYRVVATSVTNTKTIQWRTDGLEATIRIEQYLESNRCAFLSELKDYLFPRIMWTMAKNYAQGNAKQLFNRLSKEYDVKTCMKRTARDKNKLVALASWLYLVHPKLFYHVVRLKK